MNFDAEKIKAFIVNDFLGKVASRIIPGIPLFIVINNSLQIRTPTDSFLYSILTMTFYWIIGFTMELYNLQIPFVKKLYQFSKSKTPEQKSFIRLFQNIVLSMAWSVIIALLIGIYRSVRNDLPFYFNGSHYELAAYEFEIVATGLALVFFFAALIISKAKNNQT